MLALPAGAGHTGAMSFPSLPQQLARILHATLFDLGNTPVTLSALLVFVLMLIFSVWVARLAKLATRRALENRPSLDRGTARVIARLVQYVVLVVGLAVAIETLGVDLAALFAAGAFLAVGVGIAMQGVAQNIVAGVSLLIERAIKPDDILMVDGQVVRITQLGFRAAVARTRDEEDLIIPNALLAQQIVTNYTLRDSLYRLRTTVGVGYDADIDQVFRVLHDVAMQSPDRDPAREPRVLLTEFGNSSINFDLSIWVEDSWTAPIVKSRLNHAIWRAFRDNGITIPFPQMDVHFDPGPRPPISPAKL
jgi:potassium-dependent mechanosensitive channel